MPLAIASQHCKIIIGWWACGLIQIYHHLRRVLIIDAENAGLVNTFLKKKYRDVSELPISLGLQNSTFAGINSKKTDLCAVGLFS